MSLSNNKKILTSIIALVLVIFAIFLSSSKLSFQDKVKPKRGSVVESIYGLGTVTADDIFRVRAAMTLSVQKLFVREGDQVKVGDPLVKLDTNIMRSQIFGTVTEVSYKTGELVIPQASIITVTNLQHLFLEVSLEQQSILRVKEGQQVVISFESLREEKYEGTVVSIYPRDNQFIVRIAIKNRPQEVLPGMTADVAILVGNKTDVLLIPIRCIVAGQVTRIRNGKKERIPIKLGVIDGEWGEVISDNIAEDDELLIRK
jgi:membrane fusion protein, macrolide-specific efflux system